MRMPVSHTGRAPGEFVREFDACACGQPKKGQKASADRLRRWRFGWASHSREHARGSGIDNVLCRARSFRGSSS